MCLIIMSIGKYYDVVSFNKKLFAYMDIFISDDIVQGLFDHIKKTDTIRVMLLGVFC